MRFLHLLFAGILSLTTAQEDSALIAYFEAVQTQANFISANSIVEANPTAAAAESALELALIGGATLITSEVEALFAALPTQVTSLFASVLSEVVVLAGDPTTVITPTSGASSSPTTSGTPSPTAATNTGPPASTTVASSQGTTRWSGLGATLIAGTFVAMLVVL